MTALCDKPKLLPIADWPLSWRLDQWGSIIPAHHLAQMQTLGPEDANRIWKLILDAEIHADFPFKRGLFPSIESLSLQPVSHQDDFRTVRRTVKKWLFQRGIPFGRRIYLSYQPDWAVMTTWKMLIRYWDLFYYSISDDLTVIDDTMTWALLFFHEHEIHFGTRATNG